MLLSSYWARVQILVSPSVTRSRCKMLRRLNSLLSCISRIFSFTSICTCLLSFLLLLAMVDNSSCCRFVSCMCVLTIIARCTIVSWIEKNEPQQLGKVRVDSGRFRSSLTKTTRCVLYGRCSTNKAQESKSLLEVLRRKTSSLMKVDFSPPITQPAKQTSPMQECLTAGLNGNLSKLSRVPSNTTTENVSRFSPSAPQRHTRQHKQRSSSKRADIHEDPLRSIDF